MAEWARVALDASIIYVKIVVIKRDELRNGGVYELVSKTVMKRCLSLYKPGNGCVVYFLMA